MNKQEKQVFDQMLEALDEAATSLETLSKLAGKKTFIDESGERQDTYLEDFIQVRGYANSRALMAREALTKTAPMPSRFVFCNKCNEIVTDFCRNKGEKCDFQTANSEAFAAANAVSVATNKQETNALVYQNQTDLINKPQAQVDLSLTNEGYMPKATEPQVELEKVNSQIAAAIEENFGRCPNEKWFSDLLDRRDALERKLKTEAKK